jgi:uncharacterized protein (UPF0332 family)
MANIFMMNEEIARGMVCFFHQKKALLLNYIHITLHTHKCIDTHTNTSFATCAQNWIPGANPTTSEFTTSTQ